MQVLCSFIHISDTLSAYLPFDDHNHIVANAYHTDILGE